MSLLSVLETQVQNASADVKALKQELKDAKCKLTRLSKIKAGLNRKISTTLDKVFSEQCMCILSGCKLQPALICGGKQLFITFLVESGVENTASLHFDDEGTYISQFDDKVFWRVYANDDDDNKNESSPPKLWSIMQELKKDPTTLERLRLVTINYRKSKENAEWAFLAMVLTHASKKSIFSQDLKRRLGAE